jgi:hypothetical protein
MSTFNRDFRATFRRAPTSTAFCLLVASSSVVLSGRASAAAPPEASGPESRAAESSHPESSFVAGEWLRLDPFHARFGLGSGVGWMSSRAERTLAVGRVGPTLHFMAGADLFDLVSMEGGLGTIFVKDRASFSESVIDTAGDVSDADSSLNITIFSASAGVKTPDLCLGGNAERNVWAAASAHLRYGHAWLSGGRSIPNCVDCSDEDLALANGDFVDAGVHVGFKAGDGIGMLAFTTYRHYLDASSAGEVQLGIGFSYW